VSPCPPSTLAANDIRQIERICDDFEAAWNAGERPRIELFVDRVEQPLRGLLLPHLVALDWEYRVRAGDEPQPAVYTARFPELCGVIDAIRRDVMTTANGDGQPTQRLGKYRIVRQVGRGGMGVVYEAIDESLNRRVALKLMPGVNLANPTARERFWREAHTTAQLHHPNIVPIFEVGEHDGQLFLALEFIAGPTLSNQLRKSTPPPRQAAALIETIARAVHHAHQHGIVHRDLKPANVLLAISDGKSSANGDLLHYIPKVTDFGLAHRMGGSELTATGDILGTPGYMAPEQLWGDKRRSVGPTTDVYALGAVLYAALTGRPPIHGVTALDALENVRSQEPVPPSRLQPQVPRDLETICLKCLEKEPAQRYASAELLADDLRRFLTGVPIAARRPSRIIRAGRWCRRNPATAMASLLGVIAIAAAGGLAASQAFTLQLRREQQLTKAALDDAQLQRAVAAEKAEQLAEQQELTKAALVDAEQFRQQAQRLSVSLGWERGLALLDQDDIARGMLVLGHGLQIAPPEARDLEDVIRLNLAAAHRQLPYRLLSILEQGGEAQTVAFSPDGKVLLTGGRLGGARRWDAATGQPLGQPLPHEGEIRAVAFSADGQIIATASTDKTARLWDAMSGEPIGKPLAHAHWVHCVAISPDGKTVLTGSADGTARVWDFATCEQRGELRPPGWVYAVAFSPDGKLLATGSGSRAQIWHADTLEPATESLRHRGEVWTAAFSPDGRVLVTGSEDGIARLWEAETGTLIGTPLLHQAAIRSVGYSSDGKLLWTAGADGRVRFWDTATMRPRGAPVQHQSAVYAAALSPDLTRLATGNSDGRIRLWQPAAAAAGGTEMAHARLVYCAAFSPDGNTIATGSADPNVRLWDAKTGKRVGKQLAHTSSILRLVFSPDGQSLLTACSDHTARVWNMADGAPGDVVLEHANDVYSVAYSPDGKLIATGCKDSTARLWDAATGKALALPLHHPNWVHSVAFSPDGRTLFTGCEDATARLWDVATGQPVAQPIVHRGPVRAVAFSPNGRMLLTGTWDDGTARLWDAATQKPLGPPLPHQESVLAVAFSPDGKWIATGSWSGAARVWDVATGKRLGAPFVHGRTVRDVAFSPDGKTLLTASFDRTARCWELPKPLVGSVDEIVLRTQLLTGMELDEDGLFRDLDFARWDARQKQLIEIGGP
jgi:WD40 repeat protein